MQQAMPEATLLYSVTAVVVLGLVVWVAAVLKTAKEPWARTITPRSAEVHAESEADPAPELASSGPSTLDADSTARATPVALASEKAKVAAATASQEDSKADKDPKVDA